MVVDDPMIKNLTGSHLGAINSHDGIDTDLPEGSVSHRFSHIFWHTVNQCI